MHFTLGTNYVGASFLIYFIKCVKIVFYYKIQALNEYLINCLAAEKNQSCTKSDRFALVQNNLLIITDN